MRKDASAVVDVQVASDARSALDELVREGARKMLHSALEAEVADFVDRHQLLTDEQGHRLVVRNGSLPTRTVLSGAGPLDVKQPRINDRRDGCRFTSHILPPYMRRSPSLDNLIPTLYLKGISTGQFQEALEAILGPDAAGLSPATITRLIGAWEEDYREWSNRDLSGKRYVYWWADGINFNVRLEEDRTCILVIIGTLEDGTKELVTIVDGYRESKLAWQGMMRDLKRRGLRFGPKLAAADGALGFWAALSEEFPGTKEQRCWVHKTANILDKMPKSVQIQAKSMIHDMYLADTRKNALQAYDDFMDLFSAKYPKACQCLEKDKGVLFAFYDFPAAHWQHIRSTNPIESTFATVRHRSRRTKGCGSRIATLSMVFKLCQEAEQNWRRLRGYKLIPKVIQGIIFIDGIEKKAA